MPLRRRSDKRRLVAHLLLAALFVAVAAWFVIPYHGFAGPVILTITPGHGVHLGDLPSVPLLAVALWSLLRVRALTLGAVSARG
jgi:hypothetical protein